MNKKMVSIGAALVVAAAVVVLSPWRGAEGSRPFPATCRPLPTVAGAGDISIDSARGIAYVAYLDRTPKSEGRPPRGTVMLVDLNVEEPRIRAALSTDPPDFRPVALSVYVPAEGPRRLFVVDIGGSPGAVQIFEQASTGAFTLVKTVRDALLTTPTAVVAVGAEQFYATADAAWLDPATSGRFSRWWQIAFPPARSSVVYYNGTQASVVNDNLRMASGIDASPDGSAVYVTELGNKRLHVFARDGVTGGLKLRESVSLGAYPSHVHTDESGNAWLTAYPRVTAALKSLEGTVARAPTRVLRVSPGGSGDERLTLVFGDTGANLAGGSAAAGSGKGVLIGSWIDRKLLLCPNSP